MEDLVDFIMQELPQSPYVARKDEDINKPFFETLIQACHDRFKLVTRRTVSLVQIFNYLQPLKIAVELAWPLLNQMSVDEKISYKYPSDDLKKNVQLIKTFVITEPCILAAMNIFNGKGHKYTSGFAENDIYFDDTKSTDMTSSNKHAQLVIFLEVLQKITALFEYTYRAKHTDIEDIHSDCMQIFDDIPAFISEVDKGLSDSAGNLKISEYSKHLYVIADGSRHRHTEISEVGSGYPPDERTRGLNYAGVLQVYQASLNFVELIGKLCPVNVTDKTSSINQISTEVFILFLFQRCSDFQSFTDHNEHYDKDQKIKKTRPKNFRIDLSAAFATSGAATAGDAGAVDGLLPQAEDLAQTKSKRQKVQMRKPVTDVSTN